MKRKNFEINNLKEIEQEPDENKKRMMSWHWHNKSLVAEMTQQENMQLTFIFKFVEDTEEQDSV
jgi:hypothetical protein